MAPTLTLSRAAVIFQGVSPTDLKGHGETVEESYTPLPTIAEAVAEGNERLRHHADRDAPIRRATWGGQRFFTRR